jgi:CheY-like chemotaxis protein
MSSQDVHILLVEDDALDVRIMQRTFQKHQIDNPIHVACDGVEALEMLRGHNGHAPLPWPVFILLDLNMPRMNGIAFLHTLRQDPELHASIVFVLTTSDDDRDKVTAYDQHIAGYLLQSQAGYDCLRVVQLVQQFVLTVQFPPEPASSPPSLRPSVWLDLLQRTQRHGPYRTQTGNSTVGG